MKYKLLLWMSLFLISAISIWFLKQKIFYQLRLKREPNQPIESSYHQIKSSNEELFLAGISQSVALNEIPKNKIAGGIIPHHLLASQIIADFFHHLTPQKLQTIILVGPNHFEKGDAKIQTSLYDWETVFGKVESDQLITEKLLNQGLININEEVVSTELSITEIIPFIKYYLPKTKLVPIVISGRTNQKEIENLAQHLAMLINENTAMVASVDFSHYLKPDEAQKNDSQTLKIIENFDYQKLFGLGNDYLDSPPTIALLLKTMQLSGKINQNLLHHTNSAELTNNSFAETTSYFSITFY